MEQRASDRYVQPGDILLSLVSMAEEDDLALLSKVLSEPTPSSWLKKGPLQARAVPTVKPRLALEVDKCRLVRIDA